MKHLKKYNESDESGSEEIVDTIITTCYDILIDLTDDKYFTSVFCSSVEFDVPLAVIKIHIRNDKDKFVLSDVENVSNRLEKYLELEGFFKTRTSNYLCGGPNGPQTERQYEIWFIGGVQRKNIKHLK